MLSLSTQKLISLYFTFFLCISVKQTDRQKSNYFSNAFSLFHFLFAPFFHTQRIQKHTQTNSHKHKTKKLKNLNALRSMCVLSLQFRLVSLCLIDCFFAGSSARSEAPLWGVGATGWTNGASAFSARTTIAEQSAGPSGRLGCPAAHFRSLKGAGAHRGGRWRGTTDNCFCPGKKTKCPMIENTI